MPEGSLFLKKAVGYLKNPKQTTEERNTPAVCDQDRGGKWGHVFHLIDEKVSYRMWMIHKFGVQVCKQVGMCVRSAV